MEGSEAGLGREGNVVSRPRRDRGLLYRSHLILTRQVLVQRASLLAVPARITWNRCHSNIALRTCSAIVSMSDCDASAAVAAAAGSAGAADVFVSGSLRAAFAPSGFAAGLTGV